MCLSFYSRAQKRIWHGLWAFILLMYAPLVYTCLSLFHCPTLPPTQGGDTELVSYTIQFMFLHVNDYVVWCNLVTDISFTFL